MFALDLLRARGKRQRYRYLWLLEHLRQMLLNRGLRLIDRQADHLHSSIGRPKVDFALRIDGKGVGNRLIGKCAKHANQETIERLDFVRRLRHDLNRADLQDIRWFNDVGWQRYLVELRGTGLSADGSGGVTGNGLVGAKNAVHPPLAATTVDIQIAQTSLVRMRSVISHVSIRVLGRRVRAKAARFRRYGRPPSQPVQSAYSY